MSLRLFYEPEKFALDPQENNKENNEENNEENITNSHDLATIKNNIKLKHFARYTYNHINMLKIALKV